MNRLSAPLLAALCFLLLGLARADATCGTIGYCPACLGSTCSNWPYPKNATVPSGHDALVPASSDLRCEGSLCLFGSGGPRVIVAWINFYYSGSSFVSCAYNNSQAVVGGVKEWVYFFQHCYDGVQPYPNGTLPDPSYIDSTLVEHSTIHSPTLVTIGQVMAPGYCQGTSAYLTCPPS